MNSLSLTPKSNFLLFEQQFQIEAVRRTDEDTKVKLIGPDGVESTKSLDYLLHQYEMGNLKADVPPTRPQPPARRSASSHPLAADLPPADLESGRRKWKLICDIQNQGGFLRGNEDFWKHTFPGLAAKHLFDPRLSRTTVSRWLKKLGKSPDVPPEITLTPMNRLKGGAGQTRMSDEALAITDRCIEDIFLSNPGTSIRHCHLELVSRIKAANKHREAEEKLDCPSYQTLRRHVSGMSAYEICASRHGKALADTNFRSSGYVKRRLTRALQRVEVDHTPIDVFVVDKDGAILGRARLTIILDVASRAILGFSIGHDGNSVIAVFEALRHAVSPKTYLKERYPTICNEWPMHGVYELLVMDNGPEFHATNFVSTLDELCLSLDLAYMPRRKAYFKGTVESIQKFLNRDMSDLQAGATLSHHWQRNPERPPEEYAVHTLESLVELIHIWICDIYHPRIHRGLKTSALNAWRELTALMPVRLPPSPEMMELACTELVQRRIQPYGIEVCEVRSFNSEALQNVRRLYQHKGTVSVDIRFKPKLLDKIWFKDPDTQQWIEIPNDDWQTRDKSQYQLQLMNRLVREAAKDEGLVVSLADAYRRMCALGNELRSGKTIAQRKRALKILGITPSVEVGKESPALGQSAPSPDRRPVKSVGPSKPASPRTAATPMPAVPIAQPNPHISDEPTDAPVPLVPFKVISGLMPRRFS